MLKTTSILALLTVVAGILGQGKPPTGSVSGRVIDIDTLAPIVGAKVGARDIGYATTNAEGRYTLRDVEAGPKTIWVQEANGGYLDMSLTQPRHIVVTGNKALDDVDFRTRLDAAISGKVFDAADGLPPGRYYVLATNDPPPSRALLPSGSLLLEKTPETLSRLLRARSRGELVNLEPRGAAQVDLVPRALE